MVNSRPKNNVFLQDWEVIRVLTMFKSYTGSVSLELYT